MTADNPLDKPAAWRFISNAKGAKWTVQKNFPSQVAQWPGYIIEPCYSADALAAKDTAISEMRAELDKFIVAHALEHKKRLAAESMETRGPYEARICKGVPADCCDYGVVSLSEGREVCRVWREQDARAITASLSDRALSQDEPADLGVGG